MEIKRAQIWIANLEPSKASEPGKTRPVLIVQSDLINDAQHNSVVICPISSQEKTKEGKLRIAIKADMQNGLAKKSFVLTDQIRAIDILRISEKVGTVDSKTFLNVINGIKIVLDI